MNVPGISRPVLVVMIAAAAVLFAGGGAWAVSWLTNRTETHTRVLSATPRIDVEARTGDIDVVGTDRRDIRLTTREHRSIFGRPHVDVGYEAGRLRLDESCSGHHVFDGNCSVSYRLEVPRAVAVHLVTHSGDVSAADLGGDADLQTSSGDVEATDVLGTLRLRTSSGDVTADSSSTDIDASTTSGDVEVRARDADRVRAQTTSGDVTVRVPDRTYAVQTRALSGDENVDVHVDPNSPRHVDAETTSGDVRVTPDR
jgi:DUF4097 and DUF4098 domain-containing protein YvlB